VAASTPRARRKVTLERTFDADIDDVWDLWTTKQGIESWWGPEGFTVSVRELDLRPGGVLLYTMTATAPDQADFLRKAGMPLANEHRLTYTEVVPRRRIAYMHLADFIPNVEAYEVATTVDFDGSPRAVRMVLTFDAMHDDRWTDLAVRGWESELGRLERLLQGRPAPR